MRIIFCLLRYKSMPSHASTFKFSNTTQTNDILCQSKFAHLSIFGHCIGKAHLTTKTQAKCPNKFSNICRTNANIYIFRCGLRAFTILIHSVKWIATHTCSTLSVIGLYSRSISFGPWKNHPPIFRGAFYFQYASIEWIAIRMLQIK